VRALAGAGFAPGELLQHLDTYVEHLHAARYATLVYATVSPDDGLVTLAAAGHLPPVTIEPDGRAELFMEGRSTPLGVMPAGDRRPEGQFTLRPGAGFLFVTDGLVERRSEAIDVGLERLVDAVGETPHATAEALVRSLPDRLLAGRRVDDDVCLLAYRRL
jgi:sigma-B regulation protein RsbU (phosphoserine phosphatase)